MQHAVVFLAQILFDLFTRVTSCIPELAVGGRHAGPAEDVDAGLGAVKVTVVRVEAEPDVGHDVVELDLGRGGQGVRGRAFRREGHRAARRQRRVDRRPARHLNT